MILLASVSSGILQYGRTEKDAVLGQQPTGMGDRLSVSPRHSVRDAVMVPFDS